MLDANIELAIVENQIDDLKRLMLSKQAEYNAMREQLICWQERKVEIERSLEKEKNYYVATH